MPEAEFKRRMERYVELTNKALQHALPKEEGFLQHRVLKAMRYSVSAGGKRIRPILVLEFCRACGGGEELSLPLACAVEFVHTYSLIHDDLPCMDDDDTRRGQPSCHVRFGYATALLAGDALLSLAFETALCNNNLSLRFPKRAALAAGELAHASGAEGMVGGQIIDLESEGKPVGIETLEAMHRAKTGAMIVAAARMGCIAAGAPDELCRAAEEYAGRIGLAFQIVDDILDASGESGGLGKPAGSDLENNKTTYVTHLGIDESRKLAQKLTEDAQLQLLPFGREGDFLAWLAESLMRRDH